MMRRRKVMNEKPDNIINALNSLNSSLIQISGALGFLLVNEEVNNSKNKTQLIKLLNGLGYSKQQIAVILDTTENTVGVRLSEMKKTVKNNE